MAANKERVIDTNRSPKITGPVRDKWQPYDVHANAYRILTANIDGIKYEPVTAGTQIWTYVTDPDGLDIRAIRNVSKGESYLITMFEFECMNRHPVTGNPWRRYVWQKVELFTDQNWVAISRDLKKRWKEMNDPALIAKRAQQDSINSMVEM